MVAWKIVWNGFPIGQFRSFKIHNRPQQETPGYRPNKRCIFLPGASYWGLLTYYASKSTHQKKGMVTNQSSQSQRKKNNNHAVAKRRGKMCRAWLAEKTARNFSTNQKWEKNTRSGREHEINLKIALKEITQSSYPYC